MKLFVWTDYFVKRASSFVNKIRSKSILCKQKV